MSAIAETYIPEDRMGWWGGPDRRVRCSECHKVVFVCEEAATASAVKAAIRERAQGYGDVRKVMQAYRGKCGHWHVGHGWRHK